MGRLFIVLLALMGLGSAVATFLHLRAERKAEQLHLALVVGQWEKVSSLRKGGVLYRPFSARLAEQLDRAESWEGQQKRALDLLERRMEAIRRGKQTIASLSPQEMAEVERALSLLPSSFPTPREEWQELCRREHARLEARKQEEIRKLEQGFLPEATLRREPEKDIPILRHQLEQLEELEQKWLNARDAYHLPESSLAPIRERVRRARSMLKDAEEMQQLLSELPRAHHYEQYLTRMRQTVVSTYPPALHWMRLAPLLPEEETIRCHMQARRLGIPVEKLNHFRATHIQGEATFSPVCPATQKQVHLMETVFLSRSLQRALTEWVNKQGGHCLTEEAPLLEQGNMLRLTRSELDPEYSVHRSPSLLWDASGSRQLRTIHVAAFLQDCRIRRETFFRKLNLTKTLVCIVRCERSDCPALARAWLYDTLLNVMQAHPQPELMGLPYSPSLRADRNSFRQLREKCRISLESGCWLMNTPQAKKAEEAFATWFRQRRHRDYAGETSRRVEALLRIHPLYVGFVNPKGHPILCRRIPPKTSVWYFSEGRLEQSPAGLPPCRPDPLSPLFVCENTMNP